MLGCSREAGKGETLPSPIPSSPLNVSLPLSLLGFPLLLKEAFQVSRSAFHCGPPGPAHYWEVLGDTSRSPPTPLWEWGTLSRGLCALWPMALTPSPAVPRPSLGGCQTEIGPRAPLS